MQDAIFAAFLVIQHKLDGDSGTLRPLGMGRVRTIAHKIPGVVRGRVVSRVVYLVVCRVFGHEAPTSTLGVIIALDRPFAEWQTIGLSTAAFLS